MSTRRRGKGDADEEALDIDQPVQAEKVSKKSKKAKAEKVDLKLADEFGRPIDKDGWLLDPIERLKQERIGAMFAFDRRSFSCV